MLRRGSKLLPATAIPGRIVVAGSVCLGGPGGGLPADGARSTIQPIFGRYRQNMPDTLNISLSPQLAKFVRLRVESGAYSSASEVVREALRWFAARTAGSGAEAPSLLDLQEREIDRAEVREAMQRLLQLREGTTLGPGLTWKDLRDNGRR